MTDTPEGGEQQEGDQSAREPPDPEQLEQMREGALSGPHTTRGAAPQAKAQLLQTQQLNYDIYQLRESMDDLNGQLETYSERSRKLTLALIALGVLQFSVAAIAAYLRFF